MFPDQLKILRSQSNSIWNSKMCLITTRLQLS